MQREVRDGPTMRANRKWTCRETMILTHSATTATIAVDATTDLVPRLRSSGIFTTMRCCLATIVLLTVLTTGCSHLGLYEFSNQDGSEKAGASSAVATIENPLFVPVSDTEFVWNQIVDTLDDYFKIDTEDRVRQMGNTLTEGRIDTFPLVGATILEPWRKDSTAGFERLHSTLQTLRRQAFVLVSPEPGGWRVHVTVNKELEAVDRPEHATVGSSTRRHEVAFDHADSKRRGDRPNTLGWVPFGRDVELEQRIIADLRSRLQQSHLPIRLPAAP